MHSGYGITFDSACSWSVDYDIDRNFKIFGVNNSLSSHALDPTFWINGSFGSPEKRFSINFTKANTKFCLS